MNLANKRGAPREGAPLKNAFLAGSDFNNSGFSPEIQVPRVVSVLARRFALPAPTAAVVASLAGLGGRSHG